MLLNLAIGDAYGAGFEYDPPSEDRPHDLLRYVPNRAYPAIGGGAYTDDTQMSLALAEHLLDGDAPTTSALAERFHRTFRRDPRLGYSKRFQTLLETSTCGSELLEKILPQSDRSGAAMRACPIGVLPTPDAVQTWADKQARVTHDTLNGRLAARAAALASHYAYHGVGPRDQMRAWVSTQTHHDWTEDWAGPVGSPGLEAVRAALTAVALSTTLSGVLWLAVNFSGDVDTVASIALGVGGSFPDLPANLPPQLHAGLEKGAYGHDYLVALDARLAVQFPSARLLQAA